MPRAQRISHQFCRWSSGRFIAAFTLGGGLGSAVVAYVGMMASWGGCASELEAGGGFFVNALGLFGLFVMPSVAAMSADLAAGAHRLLLGSVRWRHHSDTAAKVIIAAGAVALIALVVVWVSLGNPPEGYCREPLQ